MKNFLVLFFSILIMIQTDKRSIIIITINYTQYMRETKKENKEKYDDSKKLKNILFLFASKNYKKSSKKFTI